MIKDFIVGSTITETLVVKSSEIKFTKAPGRKKYLDLVLIDGQDEINAKRWDYARDDSIPTNTVVDVQATVGEYMNKKQLTIGTLNINPDQDLTAFAPQGKIDIDRYTQMAYELIDVIEPFNLQNIVRNTFDDYREKWLKAPAANGIHHAYIAGTLQHSVDVAIKAKALAEHIPNVSIGLVLAGGLLHDFGKLWCYEIDGVVIKYTKAGHMLDHTVLGILKLEQYKTDDNADILMLLQHVIASHHGILEYGAATTPKCMEAWLVSCADGIDAKAATYSETDQKSKGDMTAKIYSMENREHFTTEFIANVLAGE